MYTDTPCQKHDTNNTQEIYTQIKTFSSNVIRMYQRNIPKNKLVNDYSSKVWNRGKNFHEEKKRITPIATYLVIHFSSFHVVILVYVSILGRRRG